MIYASNLVKTFKVPIREKGLRSAFYSLIKKEYKEIEAVKGINFSIEQGEIVAFLGPNGAGKTTTMKMLTGLIYPSSGILTVANYKPYQREKKFLHLISLIMGNRGRLNWNLPVIDSFELYKAIYDISDKEYYLFLDEMVEVMDISDLLTQPVRNLSLGQRVKCEIVLSLIHKPKILFLDEPTIGLDLIAQKKIRELIAKYNQRYNATIIICSHNMSDIEVLCKRVILINDGIIVYDGAIKSLAEMVSNEKVINIVVKEKNINLGKVATIKKQNDDCMELLVERENVTEVISYLISNQLINDINVQDIPIEEIIEKVFLKGSHEKIFKNI